MDPTMEGMQKRLTRTGHAPEAGSVFAPEPRSEPQPPAVVPKPPKNAAAVHAKRSLFVVAGVYAVLIIGALLDSISAGQFGHIPPSVLMVLVALGPVLAVAGKDYLHWAATGEWDRATQEDTE